MAATPLDTAAQDLLVSLQIRHPSVRSVLVTGVHSRNTSEFADALGAAAMTLSRTVYRCDVHAKDQPVALTSTPDTPGLTIESLNDVALTRSTIQVASEAGMFIASTKDFEDVHESRVLAACVHGVIFLAQAGRTRAGHLRSARELLDSVTGTLIGAVYIASK